MDITILHYNGALGDKGTTAMHEFYPAPTITLKLITNPM